MAVYSSHMSEKYAIKTTEVFLSIGFPLFRPLCNGSPLPSLSSLKAAPGWKMEWENGWCHFFVYNIPGTLLLIRVYTSFTCLQVASHPLQFSPASSVISFPLAPSRPLCVPFLKHATYNTVSTMLPTVSMFEGFWLSSLLPPVSSFLVFFSQSFFSLIELVMQLSVFLIYHLFLCCCNFLQLFLAFYNFLFFLYASRIQILWGEKLSVVLKCI